MTISVTGMLDLEPRVHLEERRNGRGRRAGTRTSRRSRSRRRAPSVSAASPMPLAQGGVDRGRRRLLEDLLVAALDRAVALAEVDARAVAIEQDLDLDVARADSTRRSRMSRSSPNDGRRLAPGRGDRVGERLGATDRAHALAAAARRGLDQQRDSRSARPRRSARRPTGRGRRSRRRTGTPSDAASRRAAALSPIARIASGGGPTQRIPAASDGLGEVGVLGQEPETRVERVGAGGTSGSDDGVRRRAGRARLGPSVAGTTARMPSRSHVRVMRVAISPRLAMNSVRIGRGGRRPGRCDGVPTPRTRQSRHLRHANGPQRVARAVDRSRSSAGRSASSPRCARQPGWDSVPRTSMSRSSHIRAWRPARRPARPE